MKEQRILEQAAFMSPDKRALGIILCFYTGIRLGELCALRWRDIDLEAGTMYIGNTVSRIRNFQSVESKTMLHIGTPKSKTSTRKIPLPGFLLELAKELKPGIKSEEHFILSNKNTPFEPRVYQKLYKRILKDTGIKDRKFHAIRHTFATRALEVGVDIKTLSEILGHSNVTITLNIYAHSLMEQKKAAIEKLNMMHVTQMKVV
jgi:integrase